MRIEQLTQFSIEEPSPGYWRVVFANPPVNLMNSTTVLEIGELVCRIDEAQDLAVVVFASANPDFYMARYDLSDRNPVGFARTEEGVTQFIASMRRMESARPITIAAIRGRARGGGSELALFCDLRYASTETAVMAQPEAGLGILPGGGAVERMPRLMGAPRALEVIATSDDYDAVTAERYGWINRAIPDAELDDYVDRMARRLASFDPAVLATAKRLVRERVPAPPADQYRETLDVVSTLLASPSAAARRDAVARQAAAAGPDFELQMGHYLGSISESPGSTRTAAASQRISHS